MSSLAERLSVAMTRAGCAGGVVGVWSDGATEVAAAGLADWETGESLRLQTRLPIASITKPIVATAAVRLWQQRGIPLEAPLVELLPQLADDWRASRRLSLRHLLSHTSGLRSTIAPAEVARYAYAHDGLERSVRATVYSGQTRRLGSAWQYGNPGYALAGYTLGYVERSGVDGALARLVFEPAGMAETSFGGAQASGHLGPSPVRGSYSRALRPAGGLVAPVVDLLRFAEFVVDDPSLPVTGTPVAASTAGGAYGLGWILGHGGRVRWHMGDWGGCHSLLVVVPERRVAVAVLTNDDGGVALREDLVWREVARVTGLRRPRLSAYVHVGRSWTRLAAASALAPLTTRRTAPPRPDTGVG
jgi:CubicO group peptidase (beta-lactamase class C family)